MVTITETSTRTISGPEEIAAYIRQGYEQMVADAPFATGETVDIVSRAGIAPDVGMGDVAIFLVAVTGLPWSSVLLLTGGGHRIVTQVPTENLARRASPNSGGDLSEGEGTDRMAAQA